MNSTFVGNIKANAIEYCNKVLAAKEGWAYCLDKFYKTTRIEVKFFCLTVLQDVILHRYVIYEFISYPFSLINTRFVLHQIFEV